MIESVGDTCSFVRTNQRVTGVRLTGLTVTVIDGPDTGRSVRAASGTVRIGSSSINELVLSDRASSRRHARVQLVSEGVLVEDLGSKNGTWYNGARIQSGALPDGAELTIGANTLRLERTLDAYELRSTNRPEFHGLVSGTESLRDIFALVDKLAAHDIPVLIQGETGTGKELLARALHAGGPRRKRPFQVLDCGGVARELLPGELFGHEKGAFTGAEGRRAGVFEEADGGTVVLDEVGEIPLDLQSSLLRVLETREVTRLGSRKPINLNFRIVASTNRDLKQMVEEKTFRSDLFFRLSAVSIRVPPLRERPADVPLLVHHFLDRFAKDRPQPVLHPDAMAQLVDYRWPGNVRELRNLMHAMCALHSGQPVTLAVVQGLLGAPLQVPEVQSESSARVPALKDVELRLVAQALAANDWNIRKTARELGIGRTTLYQKILRYGLKRG